MYVLQPDMITGFIQQECRIYSNMFHGAMNDPMSGLKNTYFHEQIEKGNKHKTKLPITEALCLQHHDKKGGWHLKNNQIKRFHTQHKCKGKQMEKRPIKNYECNEDLKKQKCKENMKQYRSQKRKNEKIQTIYNKEELKVVTQVIET